MKTKQDSISTEEEHQHVMQPRRAALLGNELELPSGLFSAAGDEEDGSEYDNENEKQPLNPDNDRNQQQGNHHHHDEDHGLNDAVALQGFGNHSTTATTETTTTTARPPSPANSTASTVVSTSTAATSTTTTSRHKRYRHPSITMLGGGDAANQKAIAQAHNFIELPDKEHSLDDDDNHSSNDTIPLSRIHSSDATILTAGTSESFDCGASAASSPSTSPTSNQNKHWNNHHHHNTMNNNHQSSNKTTTPLVHPEERSVLILGVTGKTGVECVRRFAEAQDAPTVYGFCRNFKNISSENMELCRKHCEELIVGDATKAADLHRALQRSRADTVVICIGTTAEDHRQQKQQQHQQQTRNPFRFLTNTSNRRTTLRTKCALALVQVLRHAPFHHVRTICISSSGAGTEPQYKVGQLGVCVLPTTNRRGAGSCVRSVVGASCILPLGNGHNLRHDFHDHTGQEEVFLGNAEILKRTTIVRPTLLSSSAGAAGKNAPRRLATFPNGESPPSFKTDRKHLARWVVTECSYHIYEGRTVNVTSV